METSTVSQRLADQISALRIDQIPPHVLHHAKLCMLDALGIGIAASRYPFADPTIQAAVALSDGAAAELPVLGRIERLGLRDALLANGTLIHGLDFDDTHAGSVVHCSASAVPSALWVSQANGASGADALVAYIIAVEIDARLGGAAQGKLQARGLHPTGIIGAFGSTAASARLLGLEPRQIGQALGIVLSFASGSMEFINDGAWTKRLHPGWAAVAGLTAATFAQHGFIGPATPFEGRFGLYATVLGSEAPVDLESVAEPFTNRWETLEVAFKPYPACHFNHAFADAALALRHKHAFELDDIESITAFIHPDQAPLVCEPLAEKQRPKSSYEAQFSVPYIIACCLSKEQFGLAELEEPTLNDPELISLMQRCTHEPDPASKYPQAYSGAITIELKTGERLEHREAVNRGAQDNPLSDDEVIEKFINNAGAVLPAAVIDSSIEDVLSLEHATDLGSLLAKLTPPKSTGIREAVSH
ncbi:MAG: MmgE/PrpD family protein [Pseudomonadota bacterium]